VRRLGNDLLAMTEAWVRKRFSLEGFSVTEITVKSDVIGIKVSNALCKVAIVVDREVIEPPVVMAEGTTVEDIENKQIQ